MVAAAAVEVTGLQPAWEQVVDSEHKGSAVEFVVAGGLDPGPTHVTVPAASWGTNGPR
jgi:hypothetical protein